MLTSTERFTAYAERMPKFKYEDHACHVLLPGQPLDGGVHFAPVYADTWRKPKKENVTYAPYIMLDFDINLSDYNLESTPFSERATLYAQFVVESLQDVNLAPTFVIPTGGGVHIYYEIHHTDANKVSDIDKLYKQFSDKQLLLENGLDVASCNIVSSGRFPGTINDKYGDYRLEIKHEDDIVNNLDDIRLSLSKLDVIEKPNEVDITVGRNVTIYRTGIALLSSGLSFDHTSAHLAGLYERIKDAGDHHFSEKEYQGIINSLRKAVININSRSEYILKLLERFNKSIDTLSLSKHKDADSTAKLVLQTIVEQYALQTGSVFPISQKHLAGLCSVSQPLISKLVRKFVQMGILDVISDKYEIGKSCKVYCISVSYMSVN